VWCFAMPRHLGLETSPQWHGLAVGAPPNIWLLHMREYLTTLFDIVCGDARVHVIDATPCTPFGPHSHDLDVLTMENDQGRDSIEMSVELIDFIAYIA